MTGLGAAILGLIGHYNIFAFYFEREETPYDGYECLSLVFKDSLDFVVKKQTLLSKGKMERPVRRLSYKFRREIMIVARR